jgi:hypothetical protein
MQEKNAFGLRFYNWSKSFMIKRLLAVALATLSLHCISNAGVIRYGYGHVLRPAAQHLPATAKKTASVAKATVRVVYRVVY